MTAIPVDFSQSDRISQIYPQLPLASKSSPIGFQVAHYRLPPNETPVYLPEQHIIGIHLDRPETVEQWWNGNCFKQQKLTYGDISIYPARCPQRQRWDETTDFIEIYLAPKLFTNAAEEIFESDYINEFHLTIRDPLILQLGLNLKADLVTNTASQTNSSLLSDRLYLESIANLLVVHLLKQYYFPQRRLQHSSEGLPQHKLKAVISYIHENLERNLGLDELASVVEMGSHYFASLFKQSTGQPPHQYVTSCRIEKAKLLLKNRRLSIYDVCYEVGFGCQSHFTKVFRKYTGTTPGRYRKKL